MKLPMNLDSDGMNTQFFIITIKDLRNAILHMVRCDALLFKEIIRDNYYNDMDEAKRSKPKL